MLVVFGDMLGLPILPPYYGLRLLPIRRRSGAQTGSDGCCASANSATTTSIICTESDRDGAASAPNRR